MTLMSKDEMRNGGESSVSLEEAPQGPARTGKSSGSTSKRERLVWLLRGYFASPVIAALSAAGMTERMLAGDFLPEEPEFGAQPETVALLFRYLHRIGLVTRNGIGKYMLTADGRTAIGRNGAFSLLTSYSEYLHSLPSALAGDKVEPKVDRLRNVRGSGQLHGRKFFPSALAFFASSAAPAALIDIGCGDGCFLELAQMEWPGLAVFGVDLSQAAVQATRKRLASSNEGALVAVTGDGCDVMSWSREVPESIKSSHGLVLSAWFVCHEFSKGSVRRLIGFFENLHRAFPQAQIILGEINDIPVEILAEDHAQSIMPEFLLFHELSRQGVLSWDDWSEIRGNIPYAVKLEKRFDEVRAHRDSPIPASFLWLLQPLS
jgi:hypothetical protein